MKTGLALTAILLTTCIFALPAGAQPVGLPVADLAEDGSQYDFEFATGVTLGTSASSIGIRETYSFLDELRGFLDVLVVDTERGDTDVGLQIGVLTPVPVDFYTDLALRGAVYLSDTDSIDEFGGNAMLVASAWTALDVLALYTGVGLDVRRDEYTRTNKPDTSKTEINPVGTLGALVTLGDNFSIFAEVMHNDQWMVSFGLRVR